MSESLDFWRGTAAERRRVEAIVKSPEADGREREAIVLALDSPLSVAAARQTLGELAAITAGRAAPSAKAKHK